MILAGSAGLLALSAGLILGWMLAVRRYADRLREATAPHVATTDTQPAEKHKSPAQYLYACSERLGVSTQTLKDLGYTVREGPTGVFTLHAAHVPKGLEAMAREAMLEIAAESRGTGTRASFPATSWRWIALTAARWARESKGPIISRPGD